MRIYLSLALALLFPACGELQSAETSQPDTKSRAEHTVSKPELTACNVLGAVSAWAPDGWMAKSLPEIADGLTSGAVTSEQLVTDYLARIERLDENGPKLQSILTLNPDALGQAREIDQRRMDGETLGSLAGVPVLLKDNIETADNMPTTAGAIVLENNITGRDSPLVTGLRDQGAIILGKTNLSQWANFRSNESVSGWSALGGQVRNPHMLDRSPCGSSSGTGAAVAASLASGGVGTETNGSIICPSNVNGIVGFKPTVGLVSQTYIVPISVSQDTAGPMTKTVRGAAMMFSAMADGDMDYAAGLDVNALSSKRVGVLRFAEGSNADIIGHFNAALEVMKVQGAELIEIDEFDPPDNYWRSTLPVLEYEFKDGLNAYLAETPKTVKARTLADVITFNANEPRELAIFDQDLFEESETKGSLTDEDYIKARDLIQTATRQDGIDKIMAENNLDMLVSPSGPVAPRVDPVNGDVWPDWAGAGWMAAVAGYPHVSVPMGRVHGIPIGVSIIGMANQDAEILSYGYAYEQASRKRRDPLFLESAESCSDIAAAMQRQ